MKLTPFGAAVRVLRMKYDRSMKDMADALGISSSHMSGIEYGEKTLADKHVTGTLSFFKGVATKEELAELRRTAEQSKDVVNVSTLKPEARNLVAAFARRLQEGDQPSADITRWLDSRLK